MPAQCPLLFQRRGRGGLYYSMRIYIIFDKLTYYVSAYGICAASPSFPKEGQGWFVIFIELTLKYEL